MKQRAVNRGFRTTLDEWSSAQQVAAQLGIRTSELIRRGLALQGVKIKGPPTPYLKTER